MKLELGNKPRTWNSIQDLIQARPGCTLSIRYKEASGNNWKGYFLNYPEVLEKLHQFESEGANLDLFTFNESAPDDILLIQGELASLDDGWSLTYSTEKVGMRQAMQNARHAHGILPLALLRYYMNDNSYQMVMDLNEKYPHCVIEFGVYGQEVGIIPGHNTLIWEVRDY